MLPTVTPPGLHEFTAGVIARYARPGARMVDLGCGPGAMSERAEPLHLEILAVDRDPGVYQGRHPFVALDFDAPSFADELGAGQFNLVLAVEVIEHVESPIGFLKNIARLLAKNGVAVITTPNVDSLAARLKFLAVGRIRMMDEHSDHAYFSHLYRPPNPAILTARDFANKRTPFFSAKWTSANAQTYSLTAACDLEGISGESHCR